MFKNYYLDIILKNLNISFSKSRDMINLINFKLLSYISEKLEIAKELLKNNLLSIKDISKVTKLSIKEIEKLEESIKSD